MVRNSGRLFAAQLWKPTKSTKTRNFVVILSISIFIQIEYGHESCRSINHSYCSTQVSANEQHSFWIVCVFWRILCCSQPSERFCDVPHKCTTVLTQSSQFLNWFVKYISQKWLYFLYRLNFLLISIVASHGLSRPLCTSLAMWLVCEMSQCCFRLLPWLFVQCIGLVVNGLRIHIVYFMLAQCQVAGCLAPQRDIANEFPTDSV